MIFELTHAIPTFLDLMAITLMIGSAWVQLWGVQPVDGAPAVTPPLFYLRLRRLTMICLLTLVASTLCGVILRGMEMTGLGLNHLLPALPTILLKTHYGAMVFLRMAGVGVAWVAWGVSRRTMTSRQGALLMLGAGMTIAFSRSNSGHLADFGNLSIQQLGDFLHLLAVSCWAGSLMALAYLLASAPVHGQEGLPPHFVAGLADRSYLLFGPLLAVLVVTGFYSARFTVGSLEALASGPYGWLFSAKLAFLLILVFRFIAPPEHGHDEVLFVSNFLRRLRVDACLVVVVLACVTVLVHRIPARHQAHLAATTLAGRHDDSQASSGTIAGEPLITLETNPAAVRVGSPVSMTVTIKDRHGAPLQGLTIIHERILHAIIVGEDLNVFAHIHPEDLGPVSEAMLTKARLPLSFSFPKPGEYLVGLDFATKERAYSKSFTLQVRDAEPMGLPRFDFSAQKTFGGYRVALTTAPGRIVPGQETRLTYHIEKDGRPVTDLGPYLGAPMHLAVVTSDLKRFIHAHGVVPGQPHEDHLHAGPPPERFGPEIETEIVFPAPGIYRIFSQTQHQKKILLFDFMVEVR